MGRRRVGQGLAAWIESPFPLASAALETRGAPGLSSAATNPRPSAGRTPNTSKMPELARASPESRVLVFTAYGGEERILSAVRGLIPPSIEIGR